MADKVGIKITVDTKDGKANVNKFSESLKNLDTTLNNLNTTLLSSNKKIEGIGSGLINTKTILKGLGIGLLTKQIYDLTASFINAGSETLKASEKIQTQFKVILGGAEQAEERYKELARFASKTPFTLNGVAEASKILETLTDGALSSGEGLKLVGDASAIAGEDFALLATHVGRAYSGLQANRPIGEAIARLQELGLITGQTRNRIEELQQASKGKQAWEELRKELEKTKGGMEELSSTLEGKTSTIKDNIGLISAQLLKASGIQDAWNSALDLTIEKLDEIADRQGAYDAVNKKSNLTLDEAIKKRDFLNGYLKDLPPLATMAIVATQKEIQELNNLIPILQDEANKQKAVNETKKEAEKTKKAKIEKDRKEREELEKNLKTQEEIIASARAYNTELKERSMLETENLLFENEEKAYEERKALDRQLKQERDSLFLSSFENRIIEIEMERDARLSAIDQMEISEKEYADLRERINLNSNKKITNLDDMATKAKIKNAITVADASLGLLKEVFGENKLFTSLDIGLSTARGIMSALAMVPPNPVLAGIIGATGAVQLAKVNGLKLANGTEYVTGRGTNRSDSVPAMLSVGERVVDSYTNSQLGGISNEELLQAVRGNSGINITINAGIGSDAEGIAQSVVNAIHIAKNRGLEPQLI